MLLVVDTHIPNIQYNIFYKDLIYDKSRLYIRHHQILLMGLAYPEEIIRQWECIKTPLKEAYILHDPFCAVTYPRDYGVEREGS